MVSLNSEIKAKLMEQGASLVGFSDIGEVPIDMRGSLNFGISIAVALDVSIVNEITRGPTERYYQEYERVNALLSHLCESAVDVLAGRRKHAKAVQPTIEPPDHQTLAAELAHKTVATRAGLGWIGKSALLVTEEYGPAVRLATVLTDAELEAGHAVNNSRCGDCKKCVESCPGKAIVGKNWQAGTERHTIYDAFACCETATKLSKKIGIPSTICGICINVCPWTRKYISRGPASSE